MKGLAHVHLKYICRSGQAISPHLLVFAIMKQVEILCIISVAVTVSRYNGDPTTLASGIDLGQGINVEPGKFGKKNKRRALNTHVLCRECVRNLDLRVQKVMGLKISRCT